MSIRRKRWFVVLPLAAISTTGLMALTSSRPANPTACDAAEHWVTAHRGELPSNLSELNKLSMGLRRHVYAHLTPDARTRIWTEKLSPFEKPAAGLSATQRAFVQKFLAEIPGLYWDSSLDTNERSARLAELSREVQSLFDKTKARELFYTIGAPIAGDAEEGFCDCATGDDEDCFSGEECDWQGAGCGVLEPGCGIGGMENCDGRCF